MKMKIIKRKNDIITSNWGKVKEKKYKNEGK